MPLTVVEWVDSEPVPGWLRFLVWFTTPKEPSPLGVKLRAFGWSGLLFGFFAVIVVILAWKVIRISLFLFVTIPLALLWLAWRGGRDIHRRHQATAPPS